MFEYACISVRMLIWYMLVTFLYFIFLFQGSIYFILFISHLYVLPVDLSIYDLFIYLCIYLPVHLFIYLPISIY